MLIVICALQVRCGDNPLPPGPSNAEENLRLYDRFLERMEREYLLASWRRSVDPHDCTAPRPFGVMPVLLLSESELTALSQKLRDPEEQHVLNLILDRAVKAQSMSIPGASKFLNQLLEQYRTSDRWDIESMGIPMEPDSGRRREAWLRAFRNAGRIEPLLLNLASAREEWALERNGDGFLNVMRRHRGYEPATAERLLRQLRSALQSSPLAQRDPWDVEAGSPELMKRLAAKLDAQGSVERATGFLMFCGLPAHPPQWTLLPPVTSDFSSFATFIIDPGKDVRVLATPAAGLQAQWRILHEVGHVAQALLVPPARFLALRRTASGAVAEGCAKIAERLAYSPEWLSVHGVDPADIAAIKEWERASELARMRGIIADVDFEVEFYRDPTSELQPKFLRIQRTVCGLNYPPEIPAWATQRSLAFEPLARMDYLLARCAQAAIYRRLRSQPGGLLGAASAQIVRTDVMNAASGRTFEEWYRRAAGEEADCTAWLEDVAQLRGNPQ